MIYAAKNIKDAHFKLIRKSKVRDLLPSHHFYKLLTSAVRKGLKNKINAINSSPHNPSELMIAKKRLHVRQYTRALEWWQTLPNTLTVRFCNQTRITDHQHTPIVFIANQTSSTLF